jgi:hypothetical protein
MYREYSPSDIFGCRTAMRQRVRMYGPDGVVRQPTQTEHGFSYSHLCWPHASRNDGISWPKRFVLDSPTRWHVKAGVA